MFFLYSMATYERHYDGSKGKVTREGTTVMYKVGDLVTFDLNGETQMGTISMLTPLQMLCVLENQKDLDVSKQKHTVVDLNTVNKANPVGGRKSRKTRKSRKSRRYRRV